MTDEAGGNDRSERLRQRRSQRQAPNEGEPSENESESSERSKRSEQSESSETSDPTVKEERVGTYMYLHESQKSEANRLYNVLKAEYEYEFNTEFEKNRHFYPLLVQYGLEGLEGLDASDIRERLDSI